MNKDKIATQQLYSQITTLSNNLQAQQEATEKAKKEAQEQKTNNQYQLLTFCTKTTQNASIAAKK